MRRAERLVCKDVEPKLTLHIGLAIMLVRDTPGGLELYNVRELSEKHRGKSNIITETVKNNLGMALELFWENPTDANKRVLVLLLQQNIARALTEEYGILPKGVSVSVAVDLAPIVLREPHEIDEAVCLINILARFESCTVPSQNHPETNWEVASGGWHPLTWSDNEWLLSGEAPTAESFRNYGLQVLNRQTPASIQTRLQEIDNAAGYTWDLGEFVSFSVSSAHQEAARLHKQEDYLGFVNRSQFSFLDSPDQ